MRAERLWGVAAAVLLCVWLEAHAEARGDHVAVIVSARWATPDEIPLPVLRRVYYGRTTRWAGRRVERYELAPGSSARAAFADVVFGRSERDLDDYWLEQALTGGAIPPREVEGAQEMVRAIVAREGSIGYVPLALLSTEDRARLRILAIRLPDGSTRPGDPAYPIQMASAREDLRRQPRRRFRRTERGLREERQAERAPQRPRPPVGSAPGGGGMAGDGRGGGGR